MATYNKYLFIIKTRESASLSNNKNDEFGYMDINRHAQLAVRRSNANASKSGNCRLKRRGGKRVRLPTFESHAYANDFIEEYAQKERVGQGVKVEQIEYPKPVPAIDPVCTSVVSIDCDTQHVIEYYTKFWMPSPDSIPSGCQITGMTPIRPNDGKIAFEVVQGAFQTEDVLSMCALLAAGSRRMKVLNKMTLRDPSLADVYNIRAIQALRKVLENGKKPSQRMVLDLSFLMLAELFAPSITRYDVYWRVLREIIISCGGLAALPTFTAQLAMGFDHHASAGTLVKPALDPFEYPELVSISPDPQRTKAETELLVGIRLSTMDNRLRLLALQAQGLTLLVDQIQGLSKDATNSVQKLLSKHVPELYAIICEPLRRSKDSKDTYNGPSVVTADDLYLLLRVSTWRKWVISCVLNCTSYGAATIPIVSDPPIVLYEVPQAWAAIARIKKLLKGSGWCMRHDVVLWIAAVRYLTSTSADDRQHYQEVLRLEAGELCIKNPLQLRIALQGHFPLDRIHHNYDLELWDAIIH